MWKSPSPVAFPMAPLRPPSMKVQCLGKKTYRQHRFSNGVLSGTREGCFFKCHLFKPPYLDLVDAVQLVHTAIRRRSKVQIFVVTVSRIEGADNRGRGGGSGEIPAAKCKENVFFIAPCCFPSAVKFLGARWAIFGSFRAAESLLVLQFSSTALKKKRKQKSRLYIPTAHEILFTPRLSCSFCQPCSFSSRCPLQL